MDALKQKIEAMQLEVDAMMHERQDAMYQHDCDLVARARLQEVVNNHCSGNYVVAYRKGEFFIEEEKL